MCAMIKQVFKILFFVLFYSSSIMALDATIVMEKAGDSIVSIYAMEGDDIIGQGSGIIASSTGVIITNFHVIEGADYLGILTTNGNLYDDVDIIDYNERMDLAVIKVKAIKLKPAIFGDSDHVKVGQEVVAIGNPEGLVNSISRGIISQVRDSGKGYKVFQSDATITYGSSGGALLNANAEVIGITSFKMGTDAGENLGFSLPINYVIPYINEEPSMSLSEFYQETGQSSWSDYSTDRANPDVGIKASDDDTIDYYQKISRYFEQEKYQEVLTELKYCDETIGNMFFCNMSKGIAYFNLEDFKNARFYLEIADELTPEDASDIAKKHLRCSLGYLYFNENEIALSIEPLEDCYGAETDPKLYQLYGFMLLYAYVMFEKWDAVDWLSNDLVNLAPTPSVQSIALVFKGIGELAKTFDVKTAMDYFYQALELDEDNGTAMCALGWIDVIAIIIALDNEDYEDVSGLLDEAVESYELGIQNDALTYICNIDDLNNIRAAQAADLRMDFEGMSKYFLKVVKSIQYVLGE